MSHSIEYYFERELRYVREALASKYATEHPEAAAALRIRPDRIDDPSVQMLIDGFALLNARTARKLDDGKAEVLAGLLHVLYPDYLRPLPSMIVGQFQLGPSRATQTDGQLLDAGSRLETESVDGEACEFRTCWPIRLLPVALGESKFIGPPFPPSSGSLSVQAVSALSTKISTLSSQVQLADLNWKGGLQFFAQESRDDAYQLAEFMFRQLIGVAVFDASTGALNGELGPEAIEPIGFDNARGILEYSPRSFAGYGLLTDLFVYPLRYSFFNLCAEQLLSRVASASAEIVFYFNRHSARLESTVGKTPLRLGCCPLINLYQPPTVALPINRVAAEMPIVVDWDRLWKHEVFSVDQVELFDPLSEQTVKLRPIYSQQPGDPTRNLENLYTIRREYIGNPLATEVPGSDVFFSSVYLTGDEAYYSDRSIYRIQVTALNRDLPLRLPSGEGRPHIYLKSVIAGVTVTSVTSPTRTVRPAAIAHDLGRVVAHLNLNHVTLFDVEPLKSLLHVYRLLCHNDPRDDLARRTIQSLSGLKLEHTTQRVVIGGRPAFVRGQQVKLQIDSSGLPSGRAYLFAAVMARFLSRYGTINSFVSTTAEIDGREVDLSWSNLGTRMSR